MGLLVIVMFVPPWLVWGWGADREASGVEQQEEESAGEPSAVLVIPAEPEVAESRASGPVSCPAAPSSFTFSRQSVNSSGETVCHYSRSTSTLCQR